MVHVQLKMLQGSFIFIVSTDVYVSVCYFSLIENRINSWKTLFQSLLLYVNGCVDIEAWLNCTCAPRIADSNGFILFASLLLLIHQIEMKEQQHLPMAVCQLFFWFGFMLVCLGYLVLQIQFGCYMYFKHYPEICFLSITSPVVFFFFVQLLFLCWFLLL